MKSWVGLLGLLVVGCGDDPSRPTLAPIDAGTDATSDSGPVGTVIGPKDGKVTIQTTPRTILPGEEAFLCQNFANPFGAAVDVVRSASKIVGSHHMFVFFDAIAGNGPLEECSGLEYTKTLHAAQTPEQVTSYPPGVGVQVTTATGLRVLTHYLNTTKAPIEATVSVTFDFVSPDEIELQAAPLFFNNFSISVPPHDVGEASQTCDIPNDIHLVDLVSHMHRQGVHFVAKTDQGTVLYEGSEWDEPIPTQFDPPLVVPAGSKITYTCSYENPTSQWLDFGESANTNEMCILSGTYFPALLGKPLVCF